MKVFLAVMLMAGSGSSFAETVKAKIDCKTAISVINSQYQQIDMERTAQLQQCEQQPQHAGLPCEADYSARLKEKADENKRVVSQIERNFQMYCYQIEQQLNQQNSLKQ